MSRNELIALQKDCVQLTSTPDARGFYGILDIKRGLKRESRKRKLPITAEMREVLVPSLVQSKCKFVLTCTESPHHPMSPNTLEDQIRRTCEVLDLPKDAGLHALRDVLTSKISFLELPQPFNISGGMVQSYFLVKNWPFF
jgi:hypothetical protein